MGPAGASPLAGPPEPLVRDDGPWSVEHAYSGVESMDSGDTSRHEDLDAAVEKFLAEAYEVAQSPISAFNDAAVALGAKADRDRRVIERARRVVQGRLQTEPDHLTKQVSALLRRALELGDWDWE
jgi:hypothetical protein